MIRRRFTVQPFRPCEHCGKWQSRRVCRKDRRRVKQAREAIAAVGRAPLYVRTWRAACWPFLAAVSLGVLAWILITWGDDPHW